MMEKKTMAELNRKSQREYQDAVKIPLKVVLDEVRSMHNVGSVFRTADSFLLEGIYLCGYTPQPPHRDIQKTALGATETVPWRHYTTTIEALQSLKAEGYVLLAIEQAHGSIMLQDVELELTKKYALVFGNEVYGVQQEVIAQCDYVIEIPQLGSKHSLNISVSAGIVIWELVKRFL